MEAVIRDHAFEKRAINVTPDDQVSIFDLLEVIAGNHAGRTTWSRTTELHQHATGRFSFPSEADGKRKNTTPVTDCAGALHILAWTICRAQSRKMPHERKQELVTLFGLPVETLDPRSRKKHKVETRPDLEINYTGIPEYLHPLHKIEQQRYFNKTAIRCQDGEMSLLDLITATIDPVNRSQKLNGIKDKAVLERAANYVRLQGTTGPLTPMASIQGAHYVLSELMGSSRSSEWSNMTRSLNLNVKRGREWIEDKIMTADDDSGVAISDLCQAITQYHVCPEDDWPYDITKFALPPPPKATADEARHLGFAAHAVVQTKDAILHCLLNDLPVMFGIQVFESFESREVAATGRVPIPDTDKEQCLGGHALTIVGSSDTRQAFKILNSWGDWGCNGCCWIPYAYVLHPDMAADFHVMTLAS